MNYIFHFRLRMILLVLFGLIFITACKKEKPQTPLKTEPDLSTLIDSTAFGDIKFGICRNDFLKKMGEEPVQNQMSEPVFDGTITEVENTVDIGSYQFKGYYYFDQDDSLYKVHLSKYFKNKYPRDDYHSAYDSIYNPMKIKYGYGVKEKTIETQKIISWSLKNKRIRLENLCYQQDCIIECSIIETRLYEKNKIRAQAVSQ